MTPNIWKRPGLVTVVAALVVIVPAGPGAAAVDVAATIRGSLTSTGGQAEGGASVGPTLAMAPDGRYVAFASEARNLVPGDTNNAADVFVRDRVAGTTERVSLSSTGKQGNDLSFQPAFSADDRYLVFSSYASNLVPGDTNGAEDIFMRDRWAGTTRPVSVSDTGAPGNSYSYSVAMSGNGQDIAFNSASTNLVPGDTNDQPDTFIRHRPS